MEHLDICTVESREEALQLSMKGYYPIQVRFGLNLFSNKDLSARYTTGLEGSLGLGAIAAQSDDHYAASAAVSKRLLDFLNHQDGQHGTSFAYPDRFAVRGIPTADSSFAIALYGGLIRPYERDQTGVWAFGNDGQGLRAWQILQALIKQHADPTNTLEYEALSGWEFIMAWEGYQPDNWSDAVGIWQKLVDEGWTTEASQHRKIGESFRRLEKTEAQKEWNHQRGAAIAPNGWRQPQVIYDSKVDGMTWWHKANPAAHNIAGAPITHPDYWKTPVVIQLLEQGLEFEPAGFDDDEDGDDGVDGVETTTVMNIGVPHPEVAEQLFGAGGLRRLASDLMRRFHPQQPRWEWEMLTERILRAPAQLKLDEDSLPEILEFIAYLSNELQSAAIDNIWDHSDLEAFVSRTITRKAEIEFRSKLADFVDLRKAAERCGVKAETFRSAFKKLNDGKGNIAGAVKIGAGAWLLHRTLVENMKRTLWPEN